MLSFGTVLLYLVTKKLPTEAHEVRETALITALFLPGFVFLNFTELST